MSTLYWLLIMGGLGSWLSGTGCQAWRSVATALPHAVLCRAAQLKDETSRVEAEAKAEKEEVKERKKRDKQWESEREARVGTWRDFMTKKGSSGCPDSAAVAEAKCYELSFAGC